MLKVRLGKPRQVKCVSPGQSQVLGAESKEASGQGNSGGPEDIRGTYLSTQPRLRKGDLMLLGIRVRQRTLANPALWVTWDISYHISGLQFPFRQRKATRETWQGCSEELVGKRPVACWGGSLLPPQRCSYLLLQTNFYYCSSWCHTKAVSNCNSPLASLAPSAAWHSCRVSSSASGWDVSMMAMVSPSSVHMIVC